MKTKFTLGFMLILLSIFTVTFLGCSDKMNSIFEVDVAACNSCGKCIEVCPSSAITMVSGKAVIDVSKCTKCGKCAIVCPTDAIQ